MLGTAHFSAAEVAQPARHGLPAAPVPVHLWPAMMRVLGALEKVRARWAQIYPASPGIRIVSAYRSEAYNAKIGGARDSRHVQGDAIDSQPVNGKIAEYQALIDSMLASGELPEVGGRGHYDTFSHLDTRPKKSGGGIARWDERTTPGKPGVAADAPEGRGELVDSTVAQRAPLWAALLLLSGSAAFFVLANPWNARLRTASAAP